MRLTITLAALPALALAACGAPADETTEDGATATTSMPPEPTAAAEDGAVSAPDQGAAEAGDMAAIPQALQGRWGLVPADCTSTRGDAKGLIEVTEDRISFYESRATLDEVAQRSDDRIRATFSFIGEGQTWMRDMALTLQDGGEVLVRSEYGEDALAEPLRYSKCA